MALGFIRIEGGIARTILVACILVSAVVSFFFAKWCFANAASPRSASIEIADLAELMGPDDPQTHFTAAVLYDRTFSPKDLEHSLKEYELTAALSPNNYLSWLELGKARGRNGDVQGAEAAFLRTLDLAPNYADVQWAYGNLLLRSGRTDDGFAQIKSAVIGKPEYVSSAAITAMELFDGDADAVRRMLGNTGAVNAALTTFTLRRKQYDQAVMAWDQIPADEKRVTFSEAGKTLRDQLAEAKRFASALNIARDIWDGGGTGPRFLQIQNGDFEAPVKLKDAQLFDWQIGAGAEPQIGVSDTQRHSGLYSLYMVFNTMQAADLRSVSQTVAVEPGRSYTLRVYCRAELKGSLAWEIVDAGDGKSLGRTQPIQTFAEWTSVSSAFSVPSGTDGVTIRLVRDGCVSSVCPISGKVWFDDIDLFPGQ